MLAAPARDAAFVSRTARQSEGRAILDPPSKSVRREESNSNNGQFGLPAVVGHLFDSSGDVH
jgi:hypothetical protein